MREVAARSHPFRIQRCSRFEDMPGRKHIAIAPFVGFGCIIPALELARKLASPSCRVTIIVCNATTSKGFQQKVLDLNRGDNMDNITFKIPSPAKDSADPTSDASKATSPAMAKQLRFMGYVRISRLEIESCLETLIKEHGVDAVISDCLWGGSIVELAAGHSIPAYYFCSTSVADLVIIGAIAAETPVNDPTHGNLYTELPSKDGKLEGVPFMFQEVFLSAQRGLKFIKGVIVNSVREVDITLVTLLKHYATLKDVQLWFVGPLLGDYHISRESTEALIVTEVQTWLDKKQERSVIYISFGSNCTPRPSQLAEILTAFKHLDKPVIFSLNPLCFKHLPDDVTVAEAGTVNDEKNKQLLVLGWAPQTTILAHPAVAVFVSHCGWNSTLESMTYGKPVVAWPFTSDQKRNGQVLAGLGMAMSLPDVDNHDHSRVVSAEELTSAVESVAGWNGDESYCTSAMKCKEMVLKTRSASGISYNELQDLLKHLC